MTRDLPPRHGLYDPAHEHDACGVSFVAQMDGTRTHALVEMAIGSLCNLDHRGAAGAEPSSGDGAGITVQVPDAFLRAVVDFELPDPGSYAVGNAFLPVDPTTRSSVKRRLAELAASEGLEVIGWREVPVRPEELGTLARAAMPVVQQLYVQSAATTSDGERRSGIALDWLAFRLRNIGEQLTIAG